MSEQFITNVNEKNLILTRAQGAVIARDFTTAAVLYKQLLRDEPSNVDYLKELGSIYVKNNEDEKAIPYYEQIITFYPHYIEAMNSLGAIFRRLKRYEESIQILQRALDEGRQTAAVNYNLGFTYKEMGNYDDAIEAFTAVIRENPSDVLAYNHMGSIYLAEKQYEKAIASYRKGLQVDPNHPILNYNLARCYTEANMTNDAIRCYEKTLRVKPGWIEAIKDFSTVLINCQKTKEASNLVQRSIQLHPNDSKLLGMLGKIYLDQYDYDSAEKTFIRARSLDGKDVDILKGLAEALEKEEKPKEALEAVNSALELEPDNKDLIKQYVYTLLSAEDYDAAHHNVQNLYEDNGQEDPQVLDLYGQYCICTKQEENAKQYFDEIEKNNKQYKNHLLSQANRYNQIGETDKAVEKAEEFVSKVKDNPEGYNTLGKIYQQAGNLEGAIDSYNKSKTLVKPNVLADKKINNLQEMIKAKKSEEPVVEVAPVTEEKVEEETPAVSGVEPEKEPEEFDFGTMGDNVPMGEALLEKEDDFFEDDLEEPVEEIEEEEESEPEPEPEPEPTPSFGEYSNPFGNNMDALEDENLSPFEDSYNEPKSENEQLVPDADLSGEGKQNKPDDEDLLDSMMNSAASGPEPVASVDDTDRAASADKADSADSADKADKADKADRADKVDSTDSAASIDNADKAEPAESTDKAVSADKAEPSDSADSSYKAEPADYSDDTEDASDFFDSLGDMDTGYDNGNEAGNNPYANQNPYENQKTYEAPQQSQVAPQTPPEPQQQKMGQKQPAYDPSAYESSMNQFANEMQKRMQEAMMESAKIAMDSAMNAQKMAQQIAEEQEKLKNRIDSMPQFEEPKAEPMVEPEMEPIVEPEMIDTEPEPAKVEPEFVPESSEINDTEENLAEKFASTNEILSEMQETGDVEAIETETETIEPEPVVENTSVVSILSGITKILEDDDAAKMNASELELFKKFLTFRDFMPAEEKEAFDTGKIRMQLEYIIAKLSGKPGLLKTVQSLIKSGLLGDDYILSEDYETEELSNELIKKVLHIMISLSENLEDKGLTQSLKGCAEAVLEKIALEEGKSEIF